MILALRRRSGNIIKFKNKSIGKGFKNWVLIEYGYIWLWEWYLVKYGSESVRKSLNFRIFKEFPEFQRIIIRFIFALSVDSFNYIFLFR
jgi:hypothetical protein